MGYERNNLKWQAIFGSEIQSVLELGAPLELRRRTVNLREVAHELTYRREKHGAVSTMVNANVTTTTRRCYSNW